MRRAPGRWTQDRAFAAVTGLLACLLAASARGQEAGERWTGLADTVFQHLTTDHGLPQAIATALEEDGDGFLWVGTQGGLAR